MLTKKGQFDVARKTIYWMIVGVMITLIVLAFAFIFGGYKSKLTYVPGEIRAEYITLRFVNNEECFAWQDASGIIHAGVIDISKFTDEQMNKCYFTNPKQGYEEFNFGLTLENEKKSIKTNNYYHKDDYTLFKEIVVRDDKGLIKKDRLIIYVQENI
ncbi:hypothetical protein HYX11_02330 [Candidatus Woesearchaeota archaeon]|nr:hypothetical protein [Candidatus Woesearchaeota archaeon]